MNLLKNWKFLFSITFGTFFFLESINAGSAEMGGWSNKFVAIYRTHVDVPEKEGGKTIADDERLVKWVQNGSQILIDSCSISDPSEHVILRLEDAYTEIYEVDKGVVTKVPGRQLHGFTDPRLFFERDASDITGKPWRENGELVSLIKDHAAGQSGEMTLKSYSDSTVYLTLFGVKSDLRPSVVKIIPKSGGITQIANLTWNGKSGAYRPGKLTISFFTENSPKLIMRYFLEVDVWKNYDIMDASAITNELAKAPTYRDETKINLGKIDAISRAKMLGSSSELYKFTPLFALKNQYHTEDFDRVGSRYMGLKTTDGGVDYFDFPGDAKIGTDLQNLIPRKKSLSRNSDLNLTKVIWQPISVNAVSACVLSACGGSACGVSFCAGSACFGSGCFTSGCGGSTCGGSGCAISACAGSGCLGSACGGSACGGSACAGSACGASVCLGSVCAASACVVSACGGSGCGGSGCGGSACLGSACAASVCVGSSCAGSGCSAGGCGGESMAFNELSHKVISADALGSLFSSINAEQVSDGVCKIRLNARVDMIFRIAEAGVEHAVKIPHGKRMEVCVKAPSVRNISISGISFDGSKNSDPSNLDGPKVDIQIEPVGKSILASCTH